MINSKNILFPYNNGKWKSEPTNIEVANGEIIRGSRKGILRVKNHQSKMIEINDVLYVPDATHNLLSIHMFTERGLEAKFDKKQCTIYDPNNPSVFLQARKQSDKLYKLDGIVYQNKAPIKQRI
jgi:hypothetical protein